MNIESLLKSVPVNTTTRMDCPFCGKLRTFSISNSKNVIKYHCFSSSCDNSSGYREYIPTTEELISMRKPRKNAAFKVPAYFLNGVAHSDVYNYLSKYHAIHAYRQGVMNIAYDKSEHRIVFLLKDKERVVGAIGRTLYKHYNPKVINYENSRIMPLIVGEYKDIGVIVEDCASAAAVNWIYKLAGIALLGTNLKDEYIPYLQKFKKLYIALDPDARKKAIEIKNSLTYVCKDVTILNIKKDIKNMTHNEWNDFVATRIRD